MRILKFFTCACLLLSLSFNVSAQVKIGKKRQLSVESTIQNTNIADEFSLKLDSLKKMYSSVSDSTLVVDDNSADMFELFQPFMYNSKNIRNNFSVMSKMSDNKNITPLIESLYFNHYNLISESDRRLMADVPLNAQTDIPARQDIDLVDAVAPVPIDIDISDVDVEVSKPNFWNYKGDFFLQFLQNYISANWYKGGESNYSALASVTLEANYNNKQKVKWENKLEMKLGYLTSKSDSLHSVKTSEDLIRLTSKLGLQATKRWYYTVQLLASTQFYKGYKSNDPTIYSDFLAPLTVNLSVGMDYSVEAMQKRLTGNIHLAPVAYNFKYVRLLPLSVRYGLDEGKKMLHELGSQFVADLTWKIANNITWKTRLYGFTTYKKAELEWENTFTLQFNRFISTNIFIYPRFDDGMQRDSHHGYWQLKEFISVGLNYSF